jgi:hypothetical protein
LMYAGKVIIARAEQSGVVRRRPSSDVIAW